MDFLDGYGLKSPFDCLFFSGVLSMLEVRNLSKIYKSKVKNGTDTHALDGVSLKFPETGMVFLLGKSGSGKSTLLNVCGGLDSPSEGEIIVKGRSSKDFSQSDFDSYRNTFVGFIFQEYNILNEFTVEDNIALALELQGKPKDKKAIAELLEQVDLSGFAKRKPNTLSGGQKQRIAIARALVKSPEIIMADEPTGALDSATGKQVFDTLKKLSEDKLVIVVSHDREFAELYADRIIELKDGKILSDVSKTQEKQEELSENVTAIGDILCIKKGSELTDDDFEHIKSVLRRNEGDVIIAGSEKDVDNFKKVNRITHDGEKEVFRDTDESKTEIKSYTPEQSRFIRSKLPAKHASKIGVSGLKTKPVRLFFTILLCVISFVLFGVLSTLMLYNSEGTFKQTMKDSRNDYIVFDKVYSYKESYYENGATEPTYSYESYSEAKFTSADIEQLKATFGDGSFGAINVNTSVTLRQSTSDYWNNELRSVAYMPEGAFLRNKIVYGTYPENKNEILVSTYFVDMIKECKTIDGTGKSVDISSGDALIGKTILIDGYSFKVTGVFDSGVIDPKFDSLKEGKNQDDNTLRREFEATLNDGTHLLIGVSEDGLKWFADRYSYMFKTGADSDSNRRGNAYIVDALAESDGGNEGRSIKFDSVGMGGMNMNVLSGSSVYYSPISSLDSSKYIMFGDSTAPSDGGVIVSTEMFVRAIRDRYNSKYNDISNELSELSRLQDEIMFINNDIENKERELADVNNRIATLEADMANPSIDPDQRVTLENEKADCLNDKNRLENEISSMKTDRDNHLSSYGDITAENLSVKIAELNEEGEAISKIIAELDIISQGREYVYNEAGEESTEVEYTSEECVEKLRKLIAENPDLTEGLTLKFMLINDRDQTPLGEETSYTVVGVTNPLGSDNDHGMDRVYFADSVSDSLWNTQKASTSYYEVTTSYKEPADAIYTKVYIPYDHSDAQTDYLWSIYDNDKFDDNSSRMGLVGSNIDSLEMVDDFVENLSKVFFWVGLVLAVFAILLFSNFISVSISQKRREIGILRAVGARSLDVFKIFFSESLVIAGICTILSTVGSAILCRVLNTQVGADLGASIFVFGIVSVLIIVAIAVVTAILATFLPVYNAAKKKPVDSIRAL